jgi:hypothetical protein
MKITRSQLVQSIKDLLNTKYKDPTVEVIHITSGVLRMRVVQDRGMPVYFRIQVVEEQR